MKILLYHVSGGFRKHTSSFCRFSDTVDLLYHKGRAKMSCNENENCIGIMQESCGSTDPFMLCKNGFVTSPGHSSSNITEKKSYSGTVVI